MCVCSFAAVRICAESQCVNGSFTSKVSQRAWQHACMGPGVNPNLVFLTCLCSPVHSCLKFSQVLGTTSANNSILIRPAGLPAIDTSKKTTGLAGFLGRRCHCVVSAILRSARSAPQIKESPRWHTEDSEKHARSIDDDGTTRHTSSTETMPKKLGCWGRGTTHCICRRPLFDERPKIAPCAIAQRAPPFS